MSPFDFHSVAKIIFGRGEVRQLGSLVAALGTRALIVYNGSGDVQRIIQLLSGAGVYAIVRRQHGEPLTVDVDAAVEVARVDACDCVIAFGGGSAIDLAKAIAGLMTNGGRAADYMEVVGQGKKITQPAVPWIAIPTTAGTGAEATRNAVIGMKEQRFKASIRSELLLPRVAIIDAELGVGVPPQVTASSGMDALCQLIESYTSIGAGPMTDALALRGIELAGRSLKPAYHDGRDLDAREEMALAALLSGITLTNAGLGAVHGFAAPLGANFPIPHGTVCAALLPHVIEANVSGLRNSPNGAKSLKRYADVGRQLMADQRIPDEEAIRACVRTTSDLAFELKIPALKQFGVTAEAIKEMVALARRASSMKFNPVVLSDDALATALRGAIDGLKARS
ncbi:MAG: iron-containing alcohol dehydrogenase [Planctomycetota bacterium]|nr:iron-containing alcohol dehydrogenase [Planctomycetota bacterium]